MPSIRGEVRDVRRNIVYSVELEGSDATQIFAFLMLQRYSEDIIVLKNVPTIKCTVKQADLTQARFGDVIISTLELEDVFDNKGEFYSDELNMNFRKKCTLKPHDRQVMRIKQYLPNGEKVLYPFHPRAGKGKDVSYEINLIRVNQITDLETSIEIIKIKKALFMKKAGVRYIVPQPDENEDEELKIAEASETSNISTSSEVVAGNLNLGYRTAANRNQCPSIPGTSRAAAMGYFSPMLASTGNTPPSKRNPKSPTSKSLPADSPPKRDPDSPRPQSASPTKGRAGRRSKEGDSQQPSIKDFLQKISLTDDPGLPPIPPIRNRTPFPLSRGKRKSDKTWSPPNKKRFLDKSIVEGSESSKASDMDTSESFTVNNRTVPKIVTDSSDDSGTSQNPVLINSTTDGDTSNEAGTKQGGEDDQPSMEDSVVIIQDSPRASLSPGGAETENTGSNPASRADSMVTHTGSTRTSRAGSTTSQASVPPAMDMDDEPADDARSIDSSLVTFHTNAPVKSKPQHVMVKVKGDKMSLRILASKNVKANQLHDLIRDFFMENEEFDHPSDNNYEATPTPSDSSWMQLTPENSVRSSSSEHNAELVIYEDMEEPADLQPTSPQEDEGGIILEQDVQDDQEKKDTPNDNVEPEKEKGEDKEDSKEKGGRA